MLCWGTYVEARDLWDWMGPTFVFAVLESLDPVLFLLSFSVVHVIFPWVGVCCDVAVRLPLLAASSVREDFTGQYER